MVCHEPACRRWRACVALHNLQAPRNCRSCVSSPELGQEQLWHDLPHFISAMEASDSICKARALHQLSLFLTFVAPSSESSFTCPDGHTISVNLQNKMVLLALNDIQMLYKVLRVELTEYTAWLFKKEGSKFSDEVYGSECSHADLILFVKVLQCCIRILPLLEFNTGLSLVAAENIHSVLKQLLCPTSFLHHRLVEIVTVYENQLQQYTPANGSPYLSFTSVETCVKSLHKGLLSHNNKETLLSHMSYKTRLTCSLQDMDVKANRIQVACALLEVFIEELLLQPYLAEVLLGSNVNLEFNISNSHDGQYGQLAMEAAVMHFIHSLSELKPGKLVHKGYQKPDSAQFGSRMCLPAAVMLFDQSIVNIEHVPDIFLVHVVNMLIKSFDSVSCFTPKLPGEMVVALAASTLESAVSLYSRFFQSSSVPVNPNLLQHGGLFHCFVDKFWTLCDGDCEKFCRIIKLLFNQKSFLKVSRQEDVSRPPISFFSHVMNATFIADSSLQCTFHATQAECYSSKQQYSFTLCHQKLEAQLQATNSHGFSSSSSTYCGTRSALLVSLLHLISTVLLQLAEEANEPNWSLLSQGMGYEEREVHAQVDTDLYIQHAKEAFKPCISVESTEVWEDLKVDQQLRREFSEVDKLTGNAFTFFAERYQSCYREGAPEAICQAYSIVLKSLLAFTEQRRTMKNLTPDKASPTCSYDATTRTSNEDQAEVVPCSDGSPHNTIFISSTLSMTKQYQRKWKSILRHSQGLARIDELKQHVDGGRVPFQKELFQETVGSSLKQHGLCPSKRSSTVKMNGDEYIKGVIASQGRVDGQNFSDLQDFIVCKEGRDYSQWMRARFKKRRRKLRKTYWERVKAKKVLLSLLSSNNNDRF